jgi:sodium/bile acid cotransporter 7
VKEHLQKQWFLISLVGVLLLGFLMPETLQPIAESTLLRQSLLFVVLFVMALPVATSELGRALKSPWGAIYATSINFLMLPALAWICSDFFFTEFLGDGLIIATVVPCTLASAAVWTRRAGGNDSIAILVTLITNGFCFLLTPWWIWMTVGGGITGFETTELIRDLALLVVLPMVLAQIARQFGEIGNQATRYKLSLSTTAQIGILVMVAIGAVKMGNRFTAGNLDFTWLDIGLMFVAVNVLHLLTLLFGYWSAGWFGFCRRDRIAIGIAGSQKTLMVGLNTAVELNRSILPMLLFHICQLVFDTLIADYWAKNNDELVTPEV